MNLSASETFDADAPFNVLRDATALALYRLGSTPNPATTRVEKLPPDYPGAEPREVELTDPYTLDLVTVMVEYNMKDGQITVYASGDTVE